MGQLNQQNMFYGPFAASSGISRPAAQQMPPSFMQWTGTREIVAHQAGTQIGGTYQI